MSELGAQNFSFTGSVHLPFSEGTVWALSVNGSTLVYADADVDGGGADMAILLQGAAAVTASDFIL